MLCASFYPPVLFFFCRSHQFWKRQGFTAWQCKWRKNPISITCPGSAPLWTSRCQSRTHQAKSVSQHRPALYRDIQLPCGCGKLSANLVHSKKSLFHRTCQCGIGTRPWGCNILSANLIHSKKSSRYSQVAATYSLAISYMPSKVCFTVVASVVSVPHTLSCQEIGVAEGRLDWTIRRCLKSSSFSVCCKWVCVCVCVCVCVHFKKSVFSQTEIFSLTTQ